MTAFPTSSSISSTSTPNHALTASDHAALPTVSVATNGGTQMLALTYRQNAMQTGVTVNIQTSSDLKTWQTVANPTFLEIGLDSVTGDPILQAQVPLNAGPQFIRLNVTSP